MLGRYLMDKGADSSIRNRSGLVSALFGTTLSILRETGYIHIGPTISSIIIVIF